MKIYVDRSEWPAAAFRTHEEAERYGFKITQLLHELYQSIRADPEVRALIEETGALSKSGDRNRDPTDPRFRAHQAKHTAAAEKLWARQRVVEFAAASDPRLVALDPALKVFGGYVSSDFWNTDYYTAECELKDDA